MAQGYGAGLWRRAVAQGYGAGLWRRAVAQSCGAELWHRAIVTELPHKSDTWDYKKRLLQKLEEAHLSPREEHLSDLIIRTYQFVFGACRLRI